MKYVWGSEIFLIYSRYNFLRLEAYFKNSLYISHMLLISVAYFVEIPSLTCYDSLVFKLVVNFKLFIFCILMCVVVMAFQIPSSTLFHSLLHSKHPIVSSQKRNRYTHSLKDTCRGTWRSKVSKCKEERLWFFYQKLFKYKNSCDIKVTIKGYYLVLK